MSDIVRELVQLGWDDERISQELAAARPIVANGGRYPVELFLPLFTQTGDRQIAFKLAF